MIWLWLSATYQQCEYPGHMTKNGWHCVDAHVQDAVESVMIIFANKGGQYFYYV